VRRRLDLCGQRDERRVGSVLAVLPRVLPAVDRDAFGPDVDQQRNARGIGEFRDPRDQRRRRGRPVEHHRAEQRLPVARPRQRVARNQVDLVPLVVGQHHAERPARLPAGRLPRADHRVRRADHVDVDPIAERSRLGETTYGKRWIPPQRIREALRSGRLVPQHCLPERTRLSRVGSLQHHSESLEGRRVSVQPELPRDGRDLVHDGRPHANATRSHVDVRHRPGRVSRQPLDERGTSSMRESVVPGFGHRTHSRAETGRHPSGTKPNTK
jgi:hypothetical protein